MRVCCMIDCCGMQWPFVLGKDLQSAHDQLTHTPSPSLLKKRKKRTYAEYTLLFKMKTGGWISAAKKLHHDVFSQIFAEISEYSDQRHNLPFYHQIAGLFIEKNLSPRCSSLL